MPVIRTGRHGKLIIATTNIVGLRDMSISDPHTMVDTTVMSNYYATQLKDVKGPWTASFAGVWDKETWNAMFALSHLVDLQNFYFYPDDSQTDYYFYAQGAFSLDSAIPMGDVVNYTGSVDGSAELKWRHGS